MINLLTWHETTQKQKRQKFIIALFSCFVITIAMTTILDFVLWQQLKKQAKESIIIKQKINNIDSSIMNIKKDQTYNDKSLKIISISKKLQQRRFETTKLLDQLPSLIPQDIYLIEIEKKKLEITLKGESNSYNNINNFLENIKDSSWLKKPVLQEVIKLDLNNKKLNQFVLKCNLH